MEGLGFESIEVLGASTDKSGDRTRQLRVHPRLKIPKLIRRRIGERLTYVEAGRFDSTLKVWRTELRLGGWEDKVKVVSEMSFSDIGPNHSRRQVDFTVKPMSSGSVRWLNGFSRKPFAIATKKHAP